MMSGLRLELSGDSLQVTGRDEHLTISSDIQVAGESDGVVILPAKLALDIVRKLPSGAVEVDASDGDPRISGGRSEFSMRSMPSHEYAVPSTAEGESVVVDTQQLSDALKQVVRAASTDEARGALTGVLMSAEETGLKLVSTDSYRLAVRALPGTTVLDEGQKVLVPSRALGELGRMLHSDEETTLILGASDVTFHTGVVSLTTGLMVEAYPPYESVIPNDTPNRLTTGREELSRAVDRVKLMAGENSPVRLSMDADGLKIHTINRDVGEAAEVLDARFEGEADEITLAFNGNFLLDGLDATTGDEVTLDIVNEKTAAVLRSTSSSEFLYVLMPVQVS